jgi:CBS domain containing-hemolysin-like protein
LCGYQAKLFVPQKATYYHGILRDIAAIILGDIVGYVVPWHLAALIVDVIVILLLIKHFFGVGWSKAIVIAVLAAVIAVIIIFVFGFYLPAAAVTLK